MAKVYTEEELNNFSRETLMAVILSMQDQIHQLNTNMELIFNLILYFCLPPERYVAVAYSNLLPYIIL